MHIKVEKLDSVSSDPSDPNCLTCGEPYSPDPGYSSSIPSAFQHADVVATARTKRLRANDRERRRVHLINCAMDTLRKVVPGLRDKRKLTKLELLKAAKNYIWMLDEALRTGKSLDQIPNRPPKEERPMIYNPYYYLRYDMPVIVKHGSFY